MKSTFGYSTFIGIIAFMASSTVAYSEEDPCAKASSAFETFSESLQSPCKSKEDCFVLNERCLPLLVMSKIRLANTSVQREYDDYRGKRVSACQPVMTKKANCVRDFKIICAANACSTIDIPIKP